MFRLPSLSELFGLFLRPTVQRATADLAGMVQRLEDAESHALEWAHRHADDIRRAEEKMAGSRALRDWFASEAEHARRVAGKLAELVS